MPTTPYRGYELYSDTAAPDLSASGEYNKAIQAIDSDMHEEIETRIEQDAALDARIDAEVSSREDADTALNAAIAKEREERTAADTAEETARTAADTALGERVTAEGTARANADAAIRGDLTLETQRRTDADTALGGRIDNAEVEISANSADLTGIKGLTYGKDKQVFIENDNGSYSSPALEEIQHEIENGTVNSISPTKVTFGNHGNGYMFGDSNYTEEKYHAICIGYDNGNTRSAKAIAIGSSNKLTSSSITGTCIAIGNNISAISDGVYIGNTLHHGTGFTSAIVICPYEVTYRSGDIVISNVGHTDKSVFAAPQLPDGPAVIFDMATQAAGHTTPEIINLHDPTLPQSAATKKYVDNAVAGASGGGPDTYVDQLQVNGQVIQADHNHQIAFEFSNYFTVSSSLEGPISIGLADQFFASMQAAIANVTFGQLEAQLIQ